MIHQHPGWLDSRLKFIDINIFGKVNGKNASSIYFRHQEVAELRCSIHLFPRPWVFHFLSDFIGCHWSSDRFHWFSLDRKTGSGTQ